MNETPNNPTQPDEPSGDKSRDAKFGNTRWTLIRSAAQTDDTRKAQLAMEQLFSIYWYPIYAFIRYRRGYGHHDAEDLTQDFFTHMLRHDTLQRAEEEKGRFRNFLLAVLCKVLANDKDKVDAGKRGKKLLTSLDALIAESLFSLEPAVQAPDEKIFDRMWAQSLVRHVLARLKKSHEEVGKARLYTKLEPYLTQPDTEGFYANCSRELGMKESAVRVALHLLRRRFGALLRSEVAQTVSHPDEVADELRHLVAALVV